jgi:hypothetical protein
MNAYLRRGAEVLVGVFLLTIAIFNLDSAPPVWWDEGWTMSVARNWVVDGHYGRSLLGRPAPPGLEATFPVTASVALSFRLLGVGLVQARIPSVIFTLGTLALLYYLARHLYNRPVAITTLLVLLFTPFHPDLHPVLAGRQVLGEIPALFFLLTGYAIFLSAHDRPLLTMPLVVCFWGTALITKLQVFPFWLTSLLVPLALAVFTRAWKTVLLIVVKSNGHCSSIASRFGHHLVCLVPHPFRGLASLSFPRHGYSQYICRGDAKRFNRSFIMPTARTTSARRQHWKQLAEQAEYCGCSRCTSGYRISPVDTENAVSFIPQQRRFVAFASGSFLQYRDSIRFSN